MNQVLQLGNSIITATDIIPLLARYRMLPQLWRELIVDSAIASIELSLEEEANAKKQFDAKHQLTTLEKRQAWLEQYGINIEQLADIATRSPKIEKFKQLTWEPHLKSHFLAHKAKLDKVIYSFLRTPDIEVAQELFFRIRAGEQTFAECAKAYSQGPEAQIGGLIGPVELSQPHPELVKILTSSQPGQVLPPTRLGEWFVIVRLEQFIPAQLDEAMRSQLLNQLFEAWIEAQLHQLHTVRLQDDKKELVAV